MSFMLELSYLCQHIYRMSIIEISLFDSKYEIVSPTPSSELTFRNGSYVILDEACFSRKLNINITLTLELSLKICSMFDKDIFCPP